MKPANINTIRWTEASNPITANIDVANDGSLRENAALVRLLCAADAGLFSSNTGLPALSDLDTLLPLSNASRLIADALRHPFGKVAFGGCGTSGRLSHLESRALNSLAKRCGLRDDCFTYLLAGGDAALVLSQEAAEDKPDAGKRDLEGLLKDVREKSPEAPVVVIGISCGLSATYVGSMLEYALNQPNDLVSCIAIGFNPIDAVKELRVEGWQSSFYEVLTKMSQESIKHKAVILNPSVGPEAIAGSSRMKGGSATKILVETLGLLSISIVTTSKTSNVLEKQPQISRNVESKEENEIVSAAREIISGFQAAVNEVYHDTRPIEHLISMASKSLTTPTSSSSNSSSSKGFMSSTGRGRIVYLGIGSAGLIGLIDASECPPTYGSYFNDVRGFLGAGWSELGNKSGSKVMTEAGASLIVPPHLRGDAGSESSVMTESVELSVQDGFLNDAVLSSLGTNDTVLLIGIEGDGTWIQDYDGDGNDNGNNESKSEKDQISSSFRTSLLGLKAAKERGCTVSYIAVGAKDVPINADNVKRSDSYGSSSFINQPNQKFLNLKKVIEEILVSPSLLSSSSSSSSSSLNPNMDKNSSSVQLLLQNNSSLDKRLGLPSGSCINFFQQLALKLTLNAITTGAHIRMGTVYGNRMVNVCLTNAKLFLRAVGIVRDVANCSNDIATESVIRSIYSIDADAPTFQELMTRSVLSHVASASSQRGIVPVAIILAKSRVRAAKDTSESALSVSATKEMLRKQPMIRLALSSQMKERF
jgi:N-acetylmuramic acid 6-phosphate (MurNAc-6-P) etherase